MALRAMPGARRVAGQALRPAQPPQNRTCRFSRIRLKHRPAHTRSTAGTVRDGTSGGRERGSYLRWRGRGAPRCWCCRPARGPDRRPPCRPRTGPAWVPWRISDSPLIHQMICYTKSLKSTQRGFDHSSSPSASLPSRDILFPLLISGRKPAECGHSLAICPNHEDAASRPISGRFPSLSAHFLRRNRTTAILVRMLESR